MKIFNMPNAVTVMGRSSSITNSFVNGVIPVIKPSEEEIDTAITILEENPEDMKCIYCGDAKTEWDHLFPLIKDKEPTGYISEIRNLVPACGKCNQSKGNSDWKEWMNGDAKQSPKTRKISDLDHRIELIEKYIEWGTPKIYDFSKIVGTELWQKHWDNYKSIINAMEDSTKTLNEIKEILRKSINGQKQTMSKSYKTNKERETTIETGADVEKAEIDKIHKRIPEWLKKEGHINRTILITFMELLENNKFVSRRELKEKCNSLVRDFNGNFNQMSQFGKKNHGKVFDVNRDDVRLWAPVEIFIKNAYNEYQKSKH
jgi:hypothetical protein